MFYWIYEIANWQLALILCVVCLGFTWMGTVLVRPVVRKKLCAQAGYNDLISFFLSAYGVFYGLLLGLIAVATYQNFADVDKNVTREAANLRNLYRDASCYPEPVRGELQGYLREYCRFVIEEEWPGHQRGTIPPGGTPRMSAFQRRLIAFEPQTKTQELLHGETIHQFNVVNEARRMRLHSVTTGLPAPLWGVVVVGAILNIVLIWLFSVDRLALHLLLGGILSVLIALLIFIVAAMDNPFRGEFSVTTDPFEMVLKSMTPELSP